MAVEAVTRSASARGMMGSMHDEHAEGRGVALEAVFEMRCRAGDLVMCERAVEAGTDWLVLHPQPQQIWLVEHISDEGMHDFRFVGHDALTEEVLDWLLPVDVTGDQHISLTVSREQVTSDPHALDDLSDAVSAASVVRASSAGSTGFSVTVGKRFVAVGVDATDGASIRYRTTDRDGLAGHLQRVLHPSAS